MLRIILFGLLVGCGSKVEGTMPVDTGVPGTGGDATDPDTEDDDDAGPGPSGATGSGTGGTTGSATGGSTDSGTGGTTDGGSGTGGSGGSSTGGSSSGGTDGGPVGSGGGEAEPGLPCRTGFFFDCDLQCVDEALLVYVGDAYCDTGPTVNLDCDFFRFDGGDCLSPEPEPDPVVGESCGDGRIYDCSLMCVSESFATEWTGDGFCEDGTAYEGAYNLFCETFEDDGGDCIEVDDSDLDADGTADAEAPIVEPVPGEMCGADRVYDCAGTCVDRGLADVWAVDAYCDGVDAIWGFHLDCAAFGYDDGACEEEDTGGSTEEAEEEVEDETAEDTAEDTVEDTAEDTAGESAEES